MTASYTCVCGRRAVQGKTRCRDCEARRGATERERLRRITGRGWRALRSRVLAEEPVCYICRRQPSVEVDHVVPRSRGGSDMRSNLRGICGPCNRRKGGS